MEQARISRDEAIDLFGQVQELVNAVDRLEKRVTELEDKLLENKIF